MWRGKFLPVTSTPAGSGKLKYSYINDPSYSESHLQRGTFGKFRILFYIFFVLYFFYMYPLRDISSPRESSKGCPRKLYNWKEGWIVSNKIFELFEFSRQNTQSPPPSLLCGDVTSDYISLDLLNREQHYVRGKDLNVNLILIILVHAR